MSIIGGMMGLMGTAISSSTQKGMHDKEMAHKGLELELANKQHERNEFWNQTNYDEQKRIYDQNYANMIGQQQYERGLQNQIFEREDSAIQRRVADMKAAGINPVLAAGSGAMAGEAVSSVTPQQAAAMRETGDDPRIAAHRSMADYMRQKRVDGFNAAAQVSNVLLGVMDSIAKINLTSAQADNLRAETGDVTARASDRAIHAGAVVGQLGVARDQLGINREQLTINQEHARAEWQRVSQGWTAEQRMATRQIAELELMKEDVNVRRKQGEIAEIDRKIKDIQHSVLSQTQVAEIETILRNNVISRRDFNIMQANGLMSSEARSGQQRFDEISRKERWVIRGNHVIDQAIDGILDTLFRGSRNVIDLFSGSPSNRRGDMRDRWGR